jgi:hypothetical protein
MDESAIEKMQLLFMPAFGIYGVFGFIVFVFENTADGVFLRKTPIDNGYRGLHRIRKRYSALRTAEMETKRNEIFDKYICYLPFFAPTEQKIRALPVKSDMKLLIPCITLIRSSVNGEEFCTFRYHSGRQGQPIFKSHYKCLRMQWTLVGGSLVAKWMVYKRSRQFTL